MSDSSPISEPLAGSYLEFSPEWLERMAWSYVELAAALSANAEQVLPPGTVYEIRLGLPEDLGPYQRMAWLAEPDRQHKELVDWAESPRFDAPTGTYLVRRARTGTPEERAEA